MRPYPPLSSLRLGRLVPLIPFRSSPSSATTTSRDATSFDLSRTLSGSLSRVRSLPFVPRSSTRLTFLASRLSLVRQGDQEARSAELVLPHVRLQLSTREGEGPHRGIRPRGRVGHQGVSSVFLFISSRRSLFDPRRDLRSSFSVDSLTSRSPSLSDLPRRLSCTLVCPSPSTWAVPPDVNANSPSSFRSLSRLREVDPVSPRPSSPTQPVEFSRPMGVQEPPFVQLPLSSDATLADLLPPAS